MFIDPDFGFSSPILAQFSSTFLPSASHIPIRNVITNTVHGKFHKMQNFKSSAILPSHGHQQLGRIRRTAERSYR
jgi:hypothetical protein